MLRGKLCIGAHSDVEVADAGGENRPLVSQAFCSALPVAYTRVPSAHRKPFASLVLDAAYEATTLAAVLNKHRGASNVVLLTLLGGGALTRSPLRPPMRMSRHGPYAAAQGTEDADWAI